jgi:hypothetical protein
LNILEEYCEKSLKKELIEKLQQIKEFAASNKLIDERNLIQKLTHPIAEIRFTFKDSITSNNRNQGYQNNRNRDNQFVGRNYQNQDRNYQNQDRNYQNQDRNYQNQDRNYQNQDRNYQNQDRNYQNQDRNNQNQDRNYQNQDLKYQNEEQNQRYLNKNQNYERSNETIPNNQLNSMQNVTKLSPNDQYNNSTNPTTIIGNIQRSFLIENNHQNVIQHFESYFKIEKSLPPKMSYLINFLFESLNKTSNVSIN